MSARVQVVHNTAPDEVAAWISRPLDSHNDSLNRECREEYMAAEEVRAIALGLVCGPQSPHPLLQRVAIEFAYRNRSAMRRQLLQTVVDLNGPALPLLIADEKAYAETLLIRGHERYLSRGRTDVLIWFWSDVWQCLTPAAKRSLVDHELTHIHVEVVPEIDAAGWFDEHQRELITKPIVVREAVHVSLRDHDIAGDFAEVWIRNGVPEDSRRALQLARARWRSLPPLSEPEALATETVVFELPPRVEEDGGQDAVMT